MTDFLFLNRLEAEIIMHKNIFFKQKFKKHERWINMVPILNQKIPDVGKCSSYFCNITKYFIQNLT